MDSSIPPPPQWVIDLSTRPSKPKPATSIPDPPGYSASKRAPPKAPSKASPSSPTPATTDTLKLKKAWELALAPAKALPMNAIMMYMSGNSLQIFSIMMVFMLFKNPVQALLQTQEVFRRFESEGTSNKLWGVKVVYVLMNCVALGLGVWKVNGMGLLP
ncbi:hypothetical protein MMC30_007392 [Trapelia coarctata]|nr:hypothetical protein [Trapelia coarctata]